MAFTVGGRAVQEVAVRSPQLSLDIPTITRAKPGHAARHRLHDAMTYWGQESAWHLHRVDRLTLERDALVLWCDAHENYHDPAFRRRNRRATHVWNMRTVAREHLADIAAKVDAICKRYEREMAVLTATYADAFHGPAPLVRPTRRRIEVE